MFGPKRDLELLKEFDLRSKLDDPQELRDQTAWWYFSSIMIHTAVKSGWGFDGCSFSQRGPRCLLVMKATHDELPYVAFVTEQNPTACVVTFCRMWLEERVPWHKDKYRSI